jgi:hypothetical protein
MDTNQLYNRLASFLGGSKCYFNVTSADGLDNIPLDVFPIYLVVNSAPLPDPGEHWVGIYIKNYKSPIEFFCSYGLGLRFYNHYFQDFSNRVGKGVVENVKPIQNINSRVCGQYVLYFLFKKYYGCSRITLYAKFSNDYRANDVYVRKFISRHKCLFHFKCCKNKQSCTKF